MGLSMKISNIMRVHWKNLFSGGGGGGGGNEKPTYREKFQNAKQEGCWHPNEHYGQRDSLVAPSVHTFLL